MMKKGNAVNWFEIPVADMERAKKFYEEILDVQLHMLKLANGLHMALFPENEGFNSGALCYFPDFYKPGKEGPILYLNANPSIDEILKRITHAGGTVLIPKNLISEERGYMAVFEDTEGNRLALNAMN